MRMLQKIGESMVAVGIVGGAFLPDILSGYTKAERLDRVKYADTP